jgi:hypothetical protein
METTFKLLTIDTEKNLLLCDTTLVGKDELVEINKPDDVTPPQACGRILRKISDPNLYEVTTAYDGHEALGRQYELGPKCVLRVVMRNLSGRRRRKFTDDEKGIVDLERDENFKEKKVSRAKTGSVRKGRK